MTIGGTRVRAAAARRTAAILALVGLGCTTDPCACSPASSSLLFYGRVVTAAGQPIGGAAIVVTLANPDCSFLPGAVPVTGALSSNDGTFRTPPDRAFAGAPVCVAIAAHHGATTGPLIAKVEGLLTRFPVAAGGVDSIGVVLRGLPGAVPELSRDTAAFFQTDSLSYVLRAGVAGYSAVISAVFTNRTAATVFIVNCNGETQLRLEKFVDGAWLPVWFPVVPACLSPPIVVAKDGSYRTQISIFGGYPGTNAFPKFAVEDPSGVYRAVWADVLSSYQPSNPFGDPLPLAARTSNRFGLTVGPGA